MRLVDADELVVKLRKQWKWLRSGDAAHTESRGYIQSWFKENTIELDIGDETDWAIDIVNTSPTIEERRDDD